MTFKSLVEFQRRAKQLGAAVEKNDVFKPKQRSELDFGSSLAPGLWVSASDGQSIYTAHFGKGWETDGIGSWNSDDLDNWTTLLMEANLPELDAILSPRDPEKVGLLLTRLKGTLEATHLNDDQKLKRIKSAVEVFERAE